MDRGQTPRWIRLQHRFEYERPVETGGTHRTEDRGPGQRSLTRQNIARVLALRIEITQMHIEQPAAHPPEQEHGIHLGARCMMGIEREAGRHGKTGSDLDKIAQCGKETGFCVFERQSEAGCLAPEIQFGNSVQHGVPAGFDRVLIAHWSLPDDGARADFTSAREGQIEILPGVRHRSGVRIEQHMGIRFQMDRGDFDAGISRDSAAFAKRRQRILPLMMEHQLSMGNAERSHRGQGSGTFQLWVEPVRGATNEHRRIERFGETSAERRTVRRMGRVNSMLAFRATCHVAGGCGIVTHRARMVPSPFGPFRPLPVDEHTSR